MIKIKVPMCMTLNRMYATFRGYRVKSKEARDYTKEVAELMSHLKFEKIEGKLKETLDMYSNWTNKDGTIKKKDCSNYEKGVNDSIFPCLPDMDDKQIWKLEINKIQSDEEYILVKIESL